MSSSFFSFFFSSSSLQRTIIRFERQRTIHSFVNVIELICECFELFYCTPITISGTFSFFWWFWMASKLIAAVVVIDTKGSRMNKLKFKPLGIFSVEWRNEVSCLSVCVSVDHQMAAAGIFPPIIVLEWTNGWMNEWVSNREYNRFKCFDMIKHIHY